MIAQPFEVPRTLRLLAEASPAGRAGPRDRGAIAGAAEARRPDRPRAGAGAAEGARRARHRDGIGVADPRCAAGPGSRRSSGPWSRTSRAQPVRILRASGIRAEANLPYAGLHQLLRPVLGELGSLPRPQRRAIEAAFRFIAASGAGSIPDRDRDPRAPLDGRSPGSGDRRRRRAVAGPTDERGALVRRPPGLVRSDRAARHGPG